MQKNLLAFSAGVDSSALFFLLAEQKISFDIALVNYHTRESSSKEAMHARKLAQQYGKKCYVKEALLEPSNFEHEARVIRYAFFEEIIRHHHYTNLITAHHLNDRLEWFLMQLTKGAGLIEILGFDEIEVRPEYTLIRPLINTDKQSLQIYLDKKNHPYFIDESNLSLAYKRNYFRKSFSNPLIDEFKTGIQKSFTYLETDKKTLFSLDLIHKIESLTLLKSTPDETRNIRQIDKVIKQMGYILSYTQKVEILTQKNVVISNQFAIVITKEIIYIAPYCKKVMPKKFKENCRKLNIPPKIRPYLFKIHFDLNKYPNLPY